MLKPKNGSQCSREVWSRLIWILTVAISVLLPKVGHAQAVSVLYNFSSQNGSASPQDVALVQGRDGGLYGTSEGNGTTSYGSIFKVSTSSAFTELFDFNSSNFTTDGCCPGQGLTLASDGNFYGAALGGGSGQNGVFFKVAPTGSFTAIHEFSSNEANPFSPPIQASDGNLYGTTANGGSGSAAYKYAPAGAFTAIYQFNGANVGASLVQAPDGFLYGTTGNGGWRHCGTIFKMSIAGYLPKSVPFLCNAAGLGPSGGPLLLASDGNFYGTTVEGGMSNGGTVFKMTPDFKISILYTFMGKLAGSKDGFGPTAGLIQATDGNLYGVTGSGGSSGMGTLYQISTGGTYNLLYNFDGTTGNAPQGTLMQHTTGMLYGTAQLGGANQLGTVYELNLGLGPFVTFVRPSGKVGRMAQILGQGFTGTTSVTFNGVPATSFTVAGPTFLTAVIPSGATTGPVVVTTPTATLTSNVNFNVTK
jgi:uncharacterized repeat protein (TIGR03803 family)